MITREDYMKNSSKLHQAYCLQFATDATFDFVKNTIGLKRIRASKDEHLNDVCKYFPGYNGSSSGPMWQWDLAPINEKLAKELGDNLSYSTRTCTSKAAARAMLEKV